ncbi:unnamed protein product [Phyllotreta striolata]|uniref:C2HC/C3H-type domain-containing protein n=1 Tax=Phyllotreta striolata TaxID=444603 RepID=A0A9N9TPR3_PHYSR|nr:unnamed protein product [Phyllotreta striolata]
MTGRSKPKPFLVLPLSQSELPARFSPEIFEMPTKRPGLRLFAKSSKKPVENNRPLTATLDKPVVLNVRLIGKIDMSKIRKEFLNISNLCRLPLTISKLKNITLSRPLSLPPAAMEKKKILANDESNHCARNVKVTGRNASKLGKNEIKTPNGCDNNNNQSKHIRTPHKQPSGIIGTPSDAKSPSTKLPQPCNTCGRPDQPERLHSHPATPSGNDKSPKLKVKSSVQKPIAIKYKSKANKSENIAEDIAMSKLDDCRAKYKQKVSNVNRECKAGSRKITLTCYICGREYGTQSLPLHEPKCLEKWERENALLPKHLQLKPPKKPTVDSRNTEEWNLAAWEAAQSNLVPCPNCGRTFYPDRLVVHQRGCKVKPKKPSVDDIINYSIQATAEIRADPVLNQPTVNGHLPFQTWQCYICKKKFSGNTIREHEKTCLKHWQMENQTEAGPSLKKEKPQPKRIVYSAENREQIKPERPVSPKKPPLFPCYLCGKLFGVNSIYIHEPQCLKKWHVENDKLPPGKRRQVPQKPDIKFTASGDVDFKGTFHRIWDNHLAELIQCQKCQRKFFPNRIEAHVKSCKCIPVKLSKSAV